LKNSVLNCNLWRSVRGMFFRIETSKLTSSGPRTIPRPELPKVVAPSGPIAMGLVNALVLMKPGPPLAPPSRDSIPPEVGIIP